MRKLNNPDDVTVTVVTCLHLVVQANPLSQRPVSKPRTLVSWNENRYSNRSNSTVPTHLQADRSWCERNVPPLCTTKARRKETWHSKKNSATLAPGHRSVAPFFLFGSRDMRRAGSGCSHIPAWCNLHWYSSGCFAHKKKSKAAIWGSMCSLSKVRSLPLNLPYSTPYDNAGANEC